MMLFYAAKKHFNEICDNQQAAASKENENESKYKIKQFTIEDLLTYNNVGKK